MIRDGTVFFGLLLNWVATILALYVILFMHGDLEADLIHALDIVFVTGTVSAAFHVWLYDYILYHGRRER